MISQSTYQKKIKPVRFRAERINGISYVVAYTQTSTITGQAELLELTISGMLQSCEKAALDYYTKHEFELFPEPIKPITAKQLEYITLIKQFSELHHRWPTQVDIAKMRGAQNGYSSDLIYRKTANHLYRLRNRKQIRFNKNDRTYSINA